MLSSLAQKLYKVEKYKEFKIKFVDSLLYLLIIQVVTMTNNNFETLKLSSKEWTIQESQGNSFYKNKITLQEFQLFQLNPNKISNQELKAYLQRSICPIPRTPKVVISDRFGQEKSIILLVQRSTFQSKSFIPHLTLKLQYLVNIKECSKVAHSLFLRYGNYYLTEEMLRFDQNGEILLWINQNFAQNHPVILTRSGETNFERAIILQIVEIFQKYCKFNLREALLMPIPSSFAQFQIKIQHLIKSQKRRLADLSNPSQKQMKYSSRPLSPEFEQSKLKQSQKQATNRRIMTKKDRIPKFITQISKNNQNSTNFKLLSTQKIDKASDEERSNLKDTKSSDLNESYTIKTVRINSVQKTKDRLSFENGEELIQTLPRNKIKRNCSPGNNTVTNSQQKTKKNEKDQFKVHKRGQPISLLDLCHKFRVSQYFDNQIDASESFCLDQRDSLSYNYFGSRPMTFRSAQRSQMSLEEEFTRLIN